MERQIDNFLTMITLLIIELVKLTMLGNSLKEFHNSFQINKTKVFPDFITILFAFSQLKLPCVRKCFCIKIKTNNSVRKLFKL